MKFVGASENALVGQVPAACVVHRFVGADPKMWRMSNPTYRSLSQQGTYPGIDLVWHDGGGALEFDMIVGHHVDPNVIEIEIIGADRVALIDGRLIGERQGFRAELGAPKSWTFDAHGQRTPVAAMLRMTGPTTVAFALGSYDQSQTLVIDPIAVAYSTYVGGTMMDAVNRVKTGPAGETYVVGETFSPTFSFSGTPTINPAFGPTSAPTTSDAFIASYNALGALQWLTIFGGSNGFGGVVDIANDLVAASNGQIYVAGNTQAVLDFPQLNSAQTPSTAATNMRDNFVVGFSATGIPLFSSRIAGENDEREGAIEFDTVLGRIYVGGNSNSPLLFQNSNPPVTSTLPYAAGDGYILALRFAGSPPMLLTDGYGSFIGAGGPDFVDAIKVDPLTRDVYVAGRADQPQVAVFVSGRA